MTNFDTPAFLKNRSTDDYFRLMQTIMPKDIDLSEGSHAWNFTRPTALVAAEISEFILPEVIKLIFPEWSYGEFLDDHAKCRGITRKPAAAATGEITVTGKMGTEIPAGSMFSTASINGAESVDYRTLEQITIPESGSVTVRVICTANGTIGNTPANTVILVGGRNVGITSVTNETAITGGTEQEDDAALQARIDEYDKSQGESFTGNVRDYRRWAMSVAGVGSVTVIAPKDDSGIVTLVITDANGVPATEELLETVYNYIMRPDDPMMRLAPVNALLNVVAPTTVSIYVRATVELKDDATVESVQNAFRERLAAYLPAAMEDGEVKYSSVYAALTASDGVNDHIGMELGGDFGDGIIYGTKNLTITSSQLPVVAEEGLELLPGTV